MRRKKEKKRSQRQCLFCRKMHGVLSRIIYFPSHFIAPHFHTYPPVFLSRAFYLLVPASLNSQPSHVSACLSLRPFYSLFPRLFASLIYVTKDFINHQFYHGRPVSWSMTRKYHFSEASDGEWLIAQRNCVLPMFEQMSSRFKSDATSLLTTNTIKYSGKHRWMNRFNVISNLAEISCRDETNI
jgi:hypothetical protein